jgi:type III pantothenate kinase
MNLVIDIGNTRSKIGLFQENTLVEQAIWTDWTLADLLHYGNQVGARNVLFSTVAAPDPGMAEALEDHFNVLELTHETKLPFRNLYGTPKTLGKDRLAGVAGAQALYPGSNCLVVDCGTCIKYDLITAEAEYRGGNIAPGVRMRIQAMHHFTARLPEVPMEMPEQTIGDSTQTALQNGAIRGAVLEIQGFVQLFEQQAMPLQTILTGGDAAFLLPFLKTHNPGIFYQPDLTLFGLNHILRHHFQ